MGVADVAEQVRGVALAQQEQQVAGHGPASIHTASAIFLSSNFCTLPVEVFGSSAKTTWRGHL